MVWVRVNPDLDVLAELHVHQTEHMWVSSAIVRLAKRVNGLSRLIFEDEKTNL